MIQSWGKNTYQIYNFSNMSTAVLRHLFNHVTNKENLPSGFEQQRENILQCQLWCLSIEGSVLFCVLCLTSSLVKSQHNKTKAFVIFTYLEQTALKHHIEKKQYAPVQPAACIAIVLWEGKVLHWLMSLPYFTCIFLTFVFKMLWFANTAPLYTFHNSLL